MKMFWTAAVFPCLFLRARSLEILSPQQYSSYSTANQIGEGAVQLQNNQIVYQPEGQVYQTEVYQPQEQVYQPQQQVYQPQEQVYQPQQQVYQPQQQVYQPQEQVYQPQQQVYQPQQQVYQPQQQVYQPQEQVYQPERIEHTYQPEEQTNQPEQTYQPMEQRMDNGYVQQPYSADTPSVLQNNNDNEIVQNAVQYTPTKPGMQRVHYTVEQEDGTTIEYYKDEPIAQIQVGKPSLFEVVKEKMKSIINPRAERRGDSGFSKMFQKIIKFFKVRNSRSDEYSGIDVQVGTVLLGLVSIAVAGVFSL